MAWFLAVVALFLGGVGLSVWAERRAMRMSPFGCVDRDDAEGLRTALSQLPPGTVRTVLPERGTLLEAAAVGGRVACIPVLVQAGAEVNDVDDVGISVLHVAAHVGQAGAVAALLAAGAEVNLKDARLRTPLDVALQAGDEAVASLLRAAGGRVGAEVRMADVLAAWPGEARAAYRLPRAFGLAVDDPRFLAAQERARSSLDRFDALRAEGLPGAVKWSLADESGSEGVWGDVEAADEAGYTVRLRSEPAHVRPPDGPVRVLRSELKDWQVEREPGRVAGGFTQRVSLEAVREEFGFLPPDLEEVLGEMED